MAPLTRARRASSSDRLPEDVLFEVLQRVPAKDLCRLRTVCRSWRSTTSDAAFITAHADRHKEPLLLATFRDDKAHVYVLDLSGNVVKRIAGADGYGGHQVLRTRLSLACLATDRNTCRLLNPATGGIRQVLPLGSDGVVLQNLCTSFALGLVARADDGVQEYKLLRCLSTFNVFRRQQLSGVQVLTANVKGGTDDDLARWRPRQGPPLCIDVRSGVVVDGVVYFLTSADYGIVSFDETPADCILSFDLAGEEWRGVLHGPSSAGNPTSGQMRRSQLTLADLNGSLVLAHHPCRGSVMDLWFLLDFESSLWVQQYSILTESVTAGLAPGYKLMPLLVLDDGRLVIYIAPIGLLFICDPGTETSTRVDMRDRLDSVGLYTGSLLSLQEEDKLL